MGLRPPEGEERDSTGVDDADDPACLLWASARILILSADGEWARPTEEALVASGFDVDALPSCTGVVSRAALLQPDLVAIDLGSTPDASGAATCEALRARTAASVMVIGQRASDAAVLDALEAGADVFVPRDASPREVVARVRALVRRVPPERSRRRPFRTSGPVGLDPACRVALVAGEKVALAEPEFVVLEALLRKPGRAVSRQELTEAYGGSRGTGSLDRHIRRLRHKLEATGSARHITAVRGMGFRFDAAGVDPKTGVPSQ